MKGLGGSEAAIYHHAFPGPPACWPQPSHVLAAPLTQTGEPGGPKVRGNSTPSAVPSSTYPLQLQLLCLLVFHLQGQLSSGP